MRLDARDLDARCFTDAALDALVAAIEVNDLIAPAEPLPDRPTLDYPRERLIDGFALSRQLWRRSYDRDALLGLVRALGRGGVPDPAAQQRFKDVRATFKHLRFAFVLYGAEHRCPVTFKAVTTAMGHLQDALKRGHDDGARRHAAALRLLLGPLPHTLMERETDRLQPCAPDAYRGFVLRQMATLRAMLAAPALTGHQFHAARKIVSRQVSFHDDLRTITAAPEHVAMARGLAAINGLMGQAHDALVLARAGGTGDYARARIVLPPDIRARLTALVDLYHGDRGTSSSLPRSR